MRLIDADALIKGFDLCIDTADDNASVLIATTFKRIVNKQHTIEPKKGKWTRPFPTRPKTYERFCSECKGKAWYCGTGDYNFCPNCGADMREGDTP